MKRFENWPSLLSGFLSSRELSTFQYGMRDCSLFAADAVLCITGIDPAHEFRGRYKTETGAAKLINPYGGLEGAVEKITQAHGMEEIPPLMAQRGDIVLIDSSLGAALAVIDLSGNVIGQAEIGVTQYPISQARRAWRVG